MNKKDRIKFHISNDDCLSKGEEYYDNGDFVMALSYLDRIDKSTLSKSQAETYFAVRSQISHVFGTDAGNFWALQYFAKHGYSDVLAPLVAYTTIENDKQLNEYKKGELPDFLQDFISSVEELAGEDISDMPEDLIAPLKKHQRFERKLEFTCDKIAKQALDEGDKHMKHGEFEEAITFFKQVPKGSSKYCEALSDIALCHLFIGNYKKSYEINKMVLETFPGNLQSILQLLSLCSILEKGDEFKEYLDIIEGMNHNPTDSLKVANILIDSRQFALAIPHFEYAYDNLNYSVEGYVTYIITLYNAGKQKRGEIELKEILKFFPDHAVLWYLLSQMDGREYISYEPLFAECVEECADIGVKILADKNFGSETFKSKKKLAYIKYALAKSKKSLGYFDAILEFKEGVDLFCELLYHPLTLAVQRTNMLRYLMKHHFTGKVLFRGDQLRYLKISYPNIQLENSSLFIGYAFAFSTLAYFESDFEGLLKRSVTAFLRAYDKAQIDSDDLHTPAMVSALLVAKLKKLPFDIICDFSGVEKRKMLYFGIMLYGEKFKEWDMIGDR